MATAQPTLNVFAVADVARAVAFYRAAFGWKVVVDVAVFVELETPGPFRIGLYERHGFGRNTAQVPVEVPSGAIAPVELYLRVDDLPAAVASAVSAGARVLSPASMRPWGDEVAYLADPDGNVVALAHVR
jgi:predicted enzyme related to lactoylglutathione lyase